MTLPCEIRHLIYLHLFSSTAIVIGSQDQVDSDGVLIDDFRGTRWHCSHDPDFHISPLEGFEEYEDRYDRFLRGRRPSSTRSAQDFEILVNRGRKHGWRNYDRGWTVSEGWQPVLQAAFREDGGILEVCRRMREHCGILEVCRQVREEAPSAMGASMELVVLDAGFQIEDLPMLFRQHCLPQIQHVTFAGDDSEVSRTRFSRGEQTFDVRYNMTST